ncbi:hypothetical protein D3C73_1134210 [compost metagenome]
MAADQLCKHQQLIFRSRLSGQQNADILTGLLLKSNPAHLLIDDFLNNVEYSIGQQLLILLGALPHHLGNIIDDNNHNEIAVRCKELQAEKIKLLLNPVQRYAVADDRQQELLPQQWHALDQLYLHLLHQLPLLLLCLKCFSDPAHHRDQLLTADRLKNIIRRMHLQRRLQIFSIIMPADKHNPCIRQQHADRSRHCDTIHRRHLHIGQYNIRL